MNRVARTNSRRRLPWMSTTASSTCSADITALRGLTSVNAASGRSEFFTGPPICSEAESEYQEARISRPLTSSDCSDRRRARCWASLVISGETDFSAKGPISSRTSIANR